MSLLLKSKKTQILLYSLACTLLIFFLNKNSNLSLYSTHKPPFNLRFLLEEEDVDKRCKKTPKKFLEKYKDLQVEDKEFLEKDSLTDKYQQVLRDMIEAKKVNKLSKYLPRIIMYVIFLIVDIIFFIMWFVLCGCCCCGNKRKESANCCSKCYFALFFFFSVIAILICVYGIIIVPCLYQSTNGVICSLYKLVFHFTEGTKDDFPGNNWKGFEGINDLIEEYNYINNINDLKECSDNDIYCRVYNSTVSVLKEEKYDENKNFFKKLKNAGLTINSTSEAINNIKNETLDQIEDVMKSLDKYCKLSLYVLFFAIIVFSLLGLLTLTPYFVCNCNCISCLYHLFWNIEMLIILLTILVGIGFGISGVVFKDAVEVLKYAKSEDNIFKNDSFLLEFNFNEKYKNITNICFNKDGKIFSHVFHSEDYYQSNISEYSKEINEFEKQYLKLQEENKDSKKSIVALYEEMNTIINYLKNLNHDLNKENLTDIFDCSFFKKDLEILLNELKNTLAKNLCFFSSVILIADLVAFLSILFGVALSSNYTGQNVPNVPETNDKHIKMSSKDNKHNMDSSSDNLRK
jgi:hypothetical protein